MTLKKGLLPAGEFRLDRNDEIFIGGMRFALLCEIGKTGSITQAGKTVGISYRTAWDAVNKMNALSDKPLVESVVGGEKGGGTRLTAQGRAMVELYAAYRLEHDKILASLKHALGDFQRFKLLAQKNSLKVSVRNQLWGKVVSIRKTALTAQVTLRIGSRETLESEITREGLDTLGLQVGDNAFALIKANWISCEPVRKTPKGKAGNRLQATIAALTQAKGGSEVRLCTTGGNVLTIFRKVHSDETPMKIGEKVIAFFAPSCVILGVP